LVERTNVRITVDSMDRIEYQIKNRPEYNSKSDFVAQAVEEKLKKLREEETKNAFASIRSNYDHSSSEYARHGIMNFDDYLNKIGDAKELENIKKETMDIKKKLNVVVQLRDEDQTNIERYDEVCVDMQGEIEEQKVETKKLREIIGELEAQISY